MLLHCIVLDDCQSVLLGKEEADLSLCCFLVFTAVNLVDGLVLHSKPGPETEQDTSMTCVIRLS